MSVTTSYRRPLAKYWEDRTVTVADVRYMIAELDPVENDAEITHLSLEVIVPPFMAEAAVNAGTARGMIHPAEAKVGYRDGTGDGLVRPHERSVDTLAFFGLFMREGHRSETAQAVFDRVQQVHHDVRGVTNTLQLHILGLLIAEPDRYVRDLGSPEFFSAKEREARYNFWRGVGTGMGLTGIPDSYDEMVAWVDEFEQRTFKPSEEARLLYQGMMRGFAGWFPGNNHFLSQQFMTAGLSPMTRQAVSAPKLLPGFHKALSVVLRAEKPTASIRKVNLSDTWVSQFSRLGEHPDLAKLGYQHDPTKDKRYLEAGDPADGYRYTVANGLESAKR